MLIKRAIAWHLPASLCLGGLSCGAELLLTTAPPAQGCQRGWGGTEICWFPAVGSFGAERAHHARMLVGTFGFSLALEPQSH